MNRHFARLLARPARTVRHAPPRRPGFRPGLEAFEDRTVPAMTLTSAGLQLGLSLTTFASNLPNNGTNSTGPIGLAYPSDGGVLVGDVANNLIYRFPTDTDNQTPASPGVTTQNPGGQPLGMATVPSGNYIAINGTIERLNNDGSVDGTYTPIPLSGALGVGGSLGNGNLFVSGAGGLYQVDPVAHTATFFVAGGFDGVTVAPDGKTVYAATGGAGAVVDGFDTTTGAMVFQTAIPFVDGTGVGTGSLTGFIFGNTNDGNVWMVSLATNQQTLIASGGSRGDFASDDSHNGTFLLTQTDSVLRLTSSNPLPAVTSLSPQTLTEAADTTLTVNGTGFFRNAVVRLNGTDLATTYVSPNQLTAFVPADLIPEEGTAGLVVYNPGFGGGPSGAVAVTITDPPVVATGGLALTAVEGQMTGTLTLATFTDPGTAPVSLDGSSVTGSIQFGGSGPNYFSPANGFVPATGYQNSSSAFNSTTVPVASGPVEFGYDDGANLISADFDGGTLVVRDVSSSGGISQTYVFTDPAFAGLTLTKTGDTFPTGGLSATLVGTTLTITNSGFATGGTFTGTFRLAQSLPVSAYGATVDWGDGSPASTGTVVDNGNGTYSVTGSHTYAEETGVNPYGVAVTITHDAAPAVTVNDTMTVTDPAVVATGGIALTAVEGQPTGLVQVATFTDPGGPESLGEYSASVDWGDSTPADFATPRVAYLGGGQFAVFASHTYADEDSGTPYTVTVTVTHGTSTPTVVTDTAAVADPAVVATAGGPISAAEGAAFGPVVLATFTDPGGPEGLGNYSADVDWGDSTPLDTGSIAVNGSVFSVVGSHTYADETAPGAPHTVTVTIHHAAAPDAVVTTTAAVADVAVVATGGFTLTTPEGTAAASQTVATFTDPGGAEGVGNYAAQVDWGDGSPATAGTISVVGGVFTVKAAGHVYTDEGTFPLTVTVTHLATAPQTVTSTADVTEADVLGGSATNFTAVRGQAFTRTVATFTNTGYPSNPASDFTATIDWGDGTPVQPGAVTGTGPGAYAVSGTHAYTAAGPFTVSVTLDDDGAGTANATATATVTTTAVVVPPVIVVGAVAGGSEVRVVNVETGGAERTFVPYGPDFKGGIAVALGDVTGDGVPDVVTAAGHGGAGHVKVFDGLTGAEVRSFFAYDPSFRDGAYVAVGDVDDDGFADIVTGAGFGGAPHVKVFSGKDGSLLASFYAYDPSFRNGVRVAVGDVTHDQKADVITGAGPGAGPHVKVFDGETLAEVYSFYAYAADFTGGVYVGAGDVDGDGFADVITGAATGGSGHVKVFDGKTGAEVKSFFAFSPNTRDGVTVAGADPRMTGKASVLVGLGAGSPGLVKLFDPATLAETDVYSTLDAGFQQGVYVG